MNIESKARAGFTSIMLRGGRMTKWKGQVASYAPQVGQLQSVSVAAMAAALALGGTVAMPSEAFAQDVTVVVDTLPPPPAIAAPPVDETNNGNGASLTINATVPVAGGSSQAGITATNGANATDITINATTVSGTSGIVVDNGGSGATTINANVISGATFDGVNIQTGGNGIDISADQISGDNRAVFINHQGSGDIDINAGSLTGNEENIAQINLGENAGNVNILIGSAGGLEQGIVLDSISTGGSIDLTVTGNVVVQRGESYAGTGVDAAINSTSSQGDISISTNNVSAINGIIAANAGTGSIDVQSAGLVLGAGGGGIQATQLGDGQGVTINAQDVLANDFGINVVMSDGQGNIDISANDIRAINVGVEGFDPLLPIAAAADQVGVLVSATSQNAGDILVNVPNITAGTGIEIVNSGDGAALVESFGQILALAGDGVSVTQNGLGAGAGTSGTAGVNDGITINLASVGAYGNGVVANMSSGQGGIDISADLVTASLTGVSVSATSANAGNILVNVTDVLAGTGIEIVNSGEGYALVQSFGQILTTSGDAINVTQNGNGAGITIEANEIFTSDFGIRANLLSGTGDVNVTVANIDAGATAIEARNEGVSDGNNGNINIAASGNLVSATGDGVFAYNGEDARALTISVNNVTAFQNGIDAENRGTGDSDIVATGTIEARNYGIRAYNADTAGNLKITANIITSGDAVDPNNIVNAGAAIAAQNYGTGFTEIVLKGAITAHGGDGISATNTENAGNLTITTQDVTARDNAILAVALGDAAAILVTTNGKISGGTEYGIVAGSNDGLGGDVTVIANDDVVGNAGAIFVTNGGVGDINIISQTKLESTGASPSTGLSSIAVAARNDASAGDINLALNDVTGVRAAVAVFNFGDSVVLRSTGKLSGLGTGLGEGLGVGVLSAAGTESVTLDVTDVEAALDDAIIVNNQGTGFTSVSASGTVTGGTAGDGIDVTHAGTDQNLTISATKLAVADANGVVAATVSGGVNGIIAVNNGTNASTTVTALGKTVGATGAGISVTNNAGAADLAITANEVEGATTGILATNNGTGNTSVTVTGKVTGGAGFNAVDVTNAATAKDLTITGTNAAATITGGVNGIFASNKGGGSTNVAVAGAVTGTTGDGIIATNDINAANLALDVAQVTGAVNGIVADNKGTGFTSVSASGTVTGGTAGDGINVTHTGVDQNLTISATKLAVADANGVVAATVSGGVNGIIAVNNGTNAATTVTALGKTVGATGAGISVTNNAGATDLAITANEVEGATTGILATNNGTGNTSVTVTGKVTGGAGFNAVDVTNAASAKDVTINATNAAATITGGVNGIFASNKGGGSTNVTVAGAVTGTTGDGIIATNDINAANLALDVAQVTGAVNGIFADNKGTGFTSVLARGAVTGTTGNGIDVINAVSGTADPVTGNVLSVEAQGDVSGAGFGIKAINNGTGNALVRATGKVTGGTGEGILATNNLGTGDLTVEAGEVIGTAGIRTTHNGDGSTKIVATGPVTGTSAEGIAAQNNATSLNLEVDARGVVVGASEGILAQNIGNGDTLVTAGGNVTGGVNFDAIRLANDASAGGLTVNATNAAATLQGGRHGIFVDNLGAGSSSSVTASGTVVGRSLNGIEVQNNAGTANLTVVANNVQGAVTGILANNQGAGFTSVSASGTVTGGTAGDGINVTHTGVDQNLTISATKLAVADANGVVAPTVFGGVNGIIAVNNGTNAATTVTALGKTVGATAAGINVTNNAGATDLAITANEVEGATQGVFARNLGTGNTSVAVTGNVTGGAGFDGIEGLNEFSANDLTINATNTSATITGGANGIFAGNQGTGSTSITAAGTVTGAIGDGINALNGAQTVNLSVNANNVSGGENGIYITNAGSGSTTLILSGDVDGATENGIEIDNEDATNGLSIVANNANSVISGQVDGINVSNNGAGSVSISVAGDIIGRTDDGLSLSNGTRSGNLSADVNNVTGNADGIVAFNNGNGSTFIRATGKVSAGLDDDGIFVSNDSSTIDLTIEAVDVSAGATGIFAQNDGSGSTVVKATGVITSTTADGINVENRGGNSRNLTVEANNVSGGQHGIILENEGTGNTSLTLNGNVTGGAGFNAVDVTNAATAKDLTITGTNAAATITGDVNGILASNQGTGSTSIAVAGKVVGTTGDGINADNAQSTQNLVIAAGEVSGAIDGIDAFNYGAGETRVTATGTVTGTGGDGIRVTAQNQDGAGIFVQAVNVTGGANAIKATNRGNGSTTVIATGDVISTGAVANVVNDGIYATNRNGGSVDLVITAVNVTGVDRGIRADNAGGSGSTTVIATGTVKGVNDTGISASNGTQATNLLVHANNVEGTYGIYADNEGTGTTTVIADGSVNGLTDTGIKAINAATGTDITITAKDVTGLKNAVELYNYGTGNSAVTVSGNATGGTAGFGLLATNAASARDLTITASGAAAKIAGGLDGIFAVNNGGGSTSITTKGDVVGTSRTGINARNAATTVDLKIDANNVSGTDFGVVAINEGKGSNSITVTGNAVGTTKSGVKAYNAASATTLTVSVKNVTGGIDGLDVVNEGSGASTVSISGKVVGGTGAGLASASKAGKLTTINLAATADVSATSGNAITNNLGDSVLNVANGAVITGAVRLGDGSDTANMLLSSTAAFAGITALDGGDNIAAADGFVDTLNLNGAGSFDLVGTRITNWELINFNAGTVGFSDALITAGALNVNSGATLNAANSLVATANVNVAANGTLLAGNASGNSNARIVGNLTSAGLINLSGAAGRVGDKLNVTANFTGNGGQVRLDTVLGGDNSPTDLVNITGNASGSTLLAVTNAGGTGGLTVGDGIKLVQVGGQSDQTAFRLLGDDVQAGGFRYGLFLGGLADPNDQDWYLRTVGLSDVAATTLSFARLSDDIAMTFLGTLHERVGEQEHLAKRGYNGGAMSGLWGRFVGKGFRERLSSPILGDVKSTGSITGLQMGLDMVRNIKGDGSATFAGIYAGHADGSSSDQNIFRGTARQSGTSKSDGWLAGIYGTHFAPSGWYANAVIQSNWLDAKANGRNGTTLETDGRTWLGSVELGKALKLAERAEFETQVQLIYGNTKFDSALDSNGIANTIDVENSLIGRVGFRLKTTKGEKYNAEGGLFSGYLKANLWHNLSGADVELTSAGQSVGGFEPKKTWVDAGLGTTLTMSKNTELFFDADVEFGLDQKTTAGTGKVGLRINW